MLDSKELRVYNQERTNGEADMSSLLRAKLQAMSKPRPGAPERRQSGLVEKVEYHPLLEGLRAPDPAALRRIGLEGDWPGIQQLLFLDCETTGLAGGAGTLAFMVGTAHISGGQLVFRQFTLGDYGDEPLMLAKLSRLMEEHGLLVTYNGKAFDVPLLRSRFVMARMRELWNEPAQLDLLLPARRLWKRRLGRVTLSALEEKVLGAPRIDDLPGSEAPRRFFGYLKTGDRELLAPVARHNRRDVLSLPLILLKLLDAYGQPQAQGAAEDLYSLGRTMERFGEGEEAIRCYRLAALPRPMISLSALRQRRTSKEALFALGLLYKKMGRHRQACAAFQRLAEGGGMGLKPLLELAKHWEHREKDYARALYWCDQGLGLCETPQERAALLHRRERLRRKRAKQIGEDRER